MLLDVTRAQGDLVAASAVAEQLLKSAPSDVADPAVAHLVADIHLNIARLAIAQKDHAKAAKQIESNRQLFTDPVQQGEALYLLAWVSDTQSQDKSPDALKDCALGYMRAVSVARQTPSKNHVPESLMRVAQIQEQLGDLKSASALYAEVATEYKGTPVASNAAREQQRLKEKTGM
jgi:tetratricopeptide (TPR) repeat protein